MSPKQARLIADHKRRYRESETKTSQKLIFFLCIVIPLGLLLEHWGLIT